jgi:hypothetical protein
MTPGVCAPNGMRVSCEAPPHKETVAAPNGGEVNAGGRAPHVSSAGYGGARRG